jgi:hypothetical protein
MASWRTELLYYSCCLIVTEAGHSARRPTPHVVRISRRDDHRGEVDSLAHVSESID